MLLLEGIVPFLFPKQWRDVFSRILQLSDGQIRFLGLAGVIFGAATLVAVHFYS